MQTYLKSKPVWIQLLIFLGMAFGLMIVLGFTGAVILSKITGISINQVQNVNRWDLANPNMIFYIRGLLLIQFLGLFFIPSLVFSYFADPKPMEFIGLRKPARYSYLLLGIAAMMVAVPIVEYAGILNQQISFGDSTQKWLRGMEEEAAKEIQFMLHVHTPKELILNLIFISLFAGIGEELFFRGILQRLLIKSFKSPWPGIIVTAIIFSGFHLQFFGFIPRVLLGIILGAVYWYSGSLWTAILAHFFYDAAIIIITYLHPSLAENPDAPLFNPSHVLVPALLSALVTFLILWQMRKITTVTYASVYKNDTPPTDEFSF